MTTERWTPETSVFPTSTETIRIEFLGLMAFCAGKDKALSNRDRCEVGILNNAPNHDLIVRMWKNSISVLNWGPSPASSLQKKLFFLRTEDPLVGPLSFYQSPSDFNRGSSDDPADFRWILDLENEEFFGNANQRANLRKDPRFTTPRFNLYNGVLYTLCRSGCFFKRERPQNSRRLGRIAKRHAAYIHLDSGQSAMVDLPGLDDSEKTLSAENRYEILIANICHPPDAQKCKDDENDFHYHYQTYEPPPGREYFDLVLDTDYPCEPIDLCERLVPDFDKGTDRAPCAASGFGGGGGLG